MSAVAQSPPPFGTVGPFTSYEQTDIYRQTFSDCIEDARRAVELGHASAVTENDVFLCEEWATQQARVVYGP